MYTAHPTTKDVVLTSVLLVPENKRRLGFVIFNNSTQDVCISFALTCVTTSCTYIIPTNSSISSPFYGYYQGPISAIRNSGTGTVTIWELI